MTKKNTFLDRGSELLRKLKQHQTPTMGEFDVIAQINKNAELLEKLITDQAKSDQEKVTQTINLSAQNSELEKLLHVLEQRRSHGALKDFKRGMRTHVGIKHTQEDIRRYSKASYGDIIKTSDSPSNQIEARSERMTDIIGGLQTKIGSELDKDDINIEKIGRLNTRLEKAKQIQGVLSGASAYKRRMGTDIPSMYEAAGSYMDKIERERKADEIKDKAKSSGGNPFTLAKEIEEGTEAVKIAMKEFHDAVIENADNQDDLAKKFNEAKDSLDQKKAQLDYLNKHGISGETKGQILASMAGKGLQGLGTLGHVGSDMYSQWAIGRQLDTTRGSTAIAGLANTMYMDYRGAARGDMAALLKVRQQNYRQAMGFGNEIGDKAETAGMVGMGADVASTAANGLEGFSKGGWLGSIAGIFSSGGQAISNISGKAAKLESGATKADATIAATQTKLDQLEALQKIPAHLLQTAYDYTMSSFDATQGAGGQRGSILGTARDVGFLGKMAGHGIDKNEVLAMTAQGVSSLGAGFNASADLLQAGQTSARGQLNSAQYWSARGQLAQSGGGASDMAKILEAAVTGGLNSSKNILEMTQGISALASQDVGSGISTVSGVTSRMQSALDVMNETGVDKNVAVGLATKSIADADAAVRDRSMSISNMIRSGDLYGTFGKSAGTISGDVLLNTTASDIGTILGSKDLKQTMGKMGLGGFAKEVEDRINTKGSFTGPLSYANLAYEKGGIKDLAEMQAGQAIREKLGIYGYSDQEAQGIQDKVLNYNNLSKDDRSSLDLKWREVQRAKGEKNVIGVEEWRASLNLDPFKYREKGETQESTDAAMGAKQAAASADVSEYKQGMDEIKKAGGFSEIIATMKMSAEAIHPKKFESLMTTTDKLDKSIDKLSKVVDNLSGVLPNAAGIKGVRSGSANMNNQVDKDLGGN